MSSRRLTGIVLLSLVAAACSEGGATTTTSQATTTVAVTTSTAVTTTVAAEPLPPHLYDDLLPILQPIAEPLGYRVTRAALISLGTYQADAAGTHLAVYVRPVNPQGAEEAASALVPLAAAYLPLVFERWQALESFDICQEPYGWPEGSTPPSDTLLDVDRAVALEIDWSTLTLSGLLAARGDGLTVSASEEVQATTAWAEAAGG